MPKSDIPMFEKEKGKESFLKQNYQEAIKHYSKVTKISLITGAFGLQIPAKRRDCGWGLDPNSERPHQHPVQLKHSNLLFAIVRISVSSIICWRNSEIRPQSSESSILLRSGQHTPRKCIDFLLCFSMVWLGSSWRILSKSKIPKKSLMPWKTLRKSKRNTSKKQKKWAKKSSTNTLQIYKKRRKKRNKQRTF